MEAIVPHVAVRGVFMLSFVVGCLRTKSRFLGLCLAPSKHSYGFQLMPSVVTGDIPPPNLAPGTTPFFDQTLYLLYPAETNITPSTTP